MMFFTKLVILVSLYVIGGTKQAYGSIIQSTVGPVNQGYLLMDTRQPASCYNMMNNNICPSSFNHQVVGENSNPSALTKLSLQGVKIQLALVAFFNDTLTCLKHLREYTCSNTLMKCIPTTKSIYGFKLEYDVNRTKKACANVKKSCSLALQATSIHNCSLIQTDPFEFSYCNKHTVVPGDICPSTDYMYPVAITKFYPIHANNLKAQFNLRFSPMIKKGSCVSEFLSAYCQILRGGICSNDMRQRIYAISRQDCFATMNKCIVLPDPKWHFLEVCKLLPDGNTATKVPLPTVSNASGNVSPATPAQNST